MCKVHNRWNQSLKNVRSSSWGLDETFKWFTASFHCDSKKSYVDNDRSIGREDAEGDDDDDAPCIRYSTKSPFLAKKEVLSCSATLSFRSSSIFSDCSCPNDTKWIEHRTTMRKLIWNEFQFQKSTSSHSKWLRREETRGEFLSNDDNAQHKHRTHDARSFALVLAFDSENKLHQHVSFKAYASSSAAQ